MPPLVVDELATEELLLSAKVESLVVFVAPPAPPVAPAPVAAAPKTDTKKDAPKPDAKKNAPKGSGK